MGSLSLRARLGLLFAIIAFGGASAQAAPARAAAPIGEHGLLWEVTGKGYPPSYIFGTIHIADPRVTHLAPPVRQAFDQAKRFAMEVRMDYGAYAELIHGMFFQDGTTLESVIGPELFAQVVKLAAKRGIPRDMVINMRPWAVMSATGIPGFKQGVALDLQLYARAIEQGKKVYGLESADEQLAVFNGMSRRDQIDMIRAIVEHRHDAAAEAQQLLAAYLDRDLDTIERLGREDLQGDSPRSAASFYQRAVIDRNRRMVRRMQTYLHQGRSFIAVGALHLPGAQGILHLLQQRGYRVTSVY